jgi:hypothetical protein
MESRAYEDGRNAYYNGDEEKQNPYSGGESREWQLGWLDAAIENKDVEE